MAEARTYIVTGGTGGVGGETARVLCGDGHRVIFTDIADPDEKLQAALEGLRGTAHFVKCDITDEAAVAALVDEAVKLGGRLDGAVNCAGVDQGIVPLADIDLALWNRTITINLTGMFLCMKHEIRAMLKSGGGSIVNIGSAMGSVAAGHQSCYVASKHGVAGLTKGGALDYAGQGIRVNALMPGVIDTPMIQQHAHEPWMADFEATVIGAHPLGRIGQPIEVAEAARWLLSDAASFVTGSLMPVDGGYTTH